MGGGVNLESVFLMRPALGTCLYVAYLFLVVLLLFNFFMAIVIDVYSYVSIQMADFAPEAKYKKNALMVFLYTYFHKLRGVQLVKEDEENIGMPDEQYIELNCLPGYVSEAWVNKQRELQTMLIDAERKMEGSKQSHSALANIGSKMRPTMFGGKAPSKSKERVPRVNDQIISRLQLQRLIDSEPQLQEVLKAKRAIDVVRRFRTERGPDPATEYFSMQENVILKLDQLEKVGLQIDFSDVEILKMVSNGLNDALTEVQNQWRSELTILLESASKISSDLIEMTTKLQQVTDKHVAIARDIIVEDVL